MGGIKNTFSKFLTNKTTVTILGVILGLGVLVGFYTYRVKNQVNPVKVPVAKREILATEEITKDDYFFYIYTFKNGNKFITYMSIKNLINNDVLQNLYGNKTTDKEQALSYNEKLKNDVINNTLDYIFKNIIVDINNNIDKLKKKYEELTSIS